MMGKHLKAAIALVILLSLAAAGRKSPLLAVILLIVIIALILTRFLKGQFIGILSFLFILRVSSSRYQEILVLVAYTTLFTPMMTFLSFTTKLRDLPLKQSL